MLLLRVGSVIKSRQLYECAWVIREKKHPQPHNNLFEVNQHYTQGKKRAPLSRHVRTWKRRIPTICLPFSKFEKKTYI